MGSDDLRAATNPSRSTTPLGFLRQARRGIAKLRARASGTAVAAKPLRPIVFFFAINGAGLGHLTRCLSVARHLREVRPVFVTTCRRAHVLDGFGIPYYSVPTFGELDSLGLLPDRKTWNRSLYRLMRALYDAYRPAALVVDGIGAHAGLVRAWREVPEIGRVCIRRAYRQDGREERILEQDREYHRILVPHDEGEADVPLPHGAAVEWVGPLVVANRDEALPRARARDELGIPQEKTTVLLQLGAGVLGRGKETERYLIERLETAGAHVAVASYDPTEERRSGTVTIVHRYPMARYLDAFDLTVAAAGYNTFTELLHHGVPTVFVPNTATLADDQLGRARRAERAGAALVGSEDDQASLGDLVDRALRDEGLRAGLARAATALVPRDGSARAAASLTAFCAEILTGAR